MQRHARRHTVNGKKGKQTHFNREKRARNQTSDRKTGKVPRLEKKTVKKTLYTGRKERKHKNTL